MYICVSIEHVTCRLQSTDGWRIDEKPILRELLVVRTGTGFSRVTEQYTSCRCLHGSVVPGRFGDNCHKNRSNTNSQKDLLRSKSKYSSWTFILLLFTRVIFHLIPLALMLITSATKFRPHVKVSVPMKSTSPPLTETKSCFLNDDVFFQCLQVVCVLSILNHTTGAY